MKNELMLTHAGGGGSRLSRTSNLEPGVWTTTRAFTMAEILLSLTIIGVVAAITLPSLTGNINERTWNTQRKAIYARFSQAISLMPSLNGFGSSETFVTAGLSKVLKLNNICSGDKFADCGFPSKITGLNNSLLNPFPTDISDFNSRAVYSPFTGGEGAAFETVNGESFFVFYNPHCVGDMGETGAYYGQRKVCANFVYDLNGKKGPNAVNKDIGFITVFYPSDSVVVAPVTLYDRAGGAIWSKAGELCRGQSDDGRLPNVHEAIALFYNRNLLSPNAVNGDLGLTHTYTSTTVSNDPAKAWYMDVLGGTVQPFTKANSGYVRCVKRNLN